MYGVADAILVEKIRHGDEQAFGELYERYHRQMYYIAQRYLKAPSLSEDAVQDVFVKIWEHRDKLDETKSIKGYLFTLLRNHVLNLIRDRKKQIVSFTEVDSMELPQRNVSEEDILYREYIDIFERGLKKLSSRKREEFKLNVNGYSNDQVAEMLQVSVRTVKTHYYHGSKFIRSYLKDNGNLNIYLFLVISGILHFSI